MASFFRSDDEFEVDGDQRWRDKKLVRINGSLSPANCYDAETWRH